MMHLEENVETNDGKKGVVKHIQKIVYGDYQAQMCYVSGEGFGGWYFDSNINGQLKTLDNRRVCPKCSGMGYLYNQYQY